MPQSQPVSLAGEGDDTERLDNYTFRNAATLLKHICKKKPKNLVRTHFIQRHLCLLEFPNGYLFRIV